MTTPISSSSSNETVWAELPTDDRDYRDNLMSHLENETPAGMCHNPTSVLSAAFCGDDLALSNACRRAKEGSIDDLLCDDLGLQKAQNFASDVAAKAAEFFISGSVGRSK